MAVARQAMEDRSGRTEDPSTPGPETSADARRCKRKTGEKGGGREEVGPEEGTRGDGVGPGMGTCRKTGGKAGSRTKRNPIGRNRSGRECSRHDQKPRCARWEPVSAEGPSRLGEDDSVGDREWEEPSTAIREASAVTKRKCDGTVGGGEELEDCVESDIEAGIRDDGQAGQGGKPESEGATATKDVVAIFRTYGSKGGGTTGVLNQGVRRVGDRRTALAGRVGRQSQPRSQRAYRSLSATRFYVFPCGTIVEHGPPMYDRTATRMARS
jgi:hypothetical protein